MIRKSRKLCVGMVFVALFILLRAPESAGAVPSLEAPSTPEKGPPDPHRVVGSDTAPVPNAT